MELRELAVSIGVESYPEELEALYTALGNTRNLVDTNGLLELEERYSLLGEYYERVASALRELEAKEHLFKWANLMCTYIKDVSRYEAVKVPIPPQDGSLAADMLSTIVLISLVPDAVKKYSERGFSEEEIKKNLENIKINLSVNELTGGEATLPLNLYSWILVYIKALIFDHKGFNYQPSTWRYSSMVLKNKNTDEYAMIMLNGSFSKDGLVIGSCGVPEEDFAFGAEFCEDTNLFFGHPVINGRVSPTLKRFDKSEWRACLRPGDDVISLHIPRNTNLSPDYVTESIAEGLSLAKKFYPETDPKCIICISWLMDPKLIDILGPDAKLSKFSERFMKHPCLDPRGNGCMGYVWPGEKCEIKDLSERTTLQRGIKKLLLEGDFIRTTTGVILTDL